VNAKRSNGTPLLRTRYPRACLGELASQFLARRNTIPYARLVGLGKTTGRACWAKKPATGGTVTSSALFVLCVWR
jgi:hypothetical protein